MKNHIGLHKSELDTPVLVIDKAKLIANLQLMSELAKQKNVLVRPHAKTHKCTKLSKLQIEHGAIGICVTKVSEAYVMAESGIRGILITSPIVTINKINNLIKVLKLAPDTILVLDNIANAIQLDSILKDHNLKLNVLLDINSGIGRTGVEFTQAVDIAIAINQRSNLNFIGIQCYAGHIQHITDLTQRRRLSHAILKKAHAVQQQLLEIGINCKIQTGSGTGTFSIDAELPGVTEIQPGSYCVMDQEYNDIEYKEIKFVTAMTMLTTVISANQLNHVTVDAGTKALYRVATPPHIISHDNLTYDWDCFGDEHGKVFCTNADDGILPTLGEQLELVVAHCDPTINLFDQFYITEKDIVIDIWDIDMRGCCK